MSHTHHTAGCSHNVHPLPPPRVRCGGHLVHGDQLNIHDQFMQHTHNDDMSRPAKCKFFRSKFLLWTFSATSLIAAPSVYKKNRTLLKKHTISVFCLNLKYSMKFVLYRWKLLNDITEMKLYKWHFWN
jgi:hypothetical protein